MKAAATEDGTFVIDFYDSSKLSSTSGTGLTNSNYSSFVSVPAGANVSSVVTSVSVTGTVQYGKNGGLTAGNGTAADANTHYVTFNIGEAYAVKKCTVYATAYESGRWLLNGNAAASGSLGEKGAKIETISTPLVWNFAEGQKTLTFTKDNGSNGNQKRLTIYRIVCEYGSSVAAPTIEPADGSTISGTQSVTISQADSKPVYYTTDGSTPTKSSTLYTGAFNVAASAVTGKVTVKAIAYDGEEASSIVSATYTDTSIQPLNVAFTFNNALFGTSYSGSVNKATIEAAGGNVTGTVNNVQVEYALGTGSNFYLKDSEIHVYSGNTLTFTAPTGYNITKIVFTGGTLQYNGSALSNRTWEGEENSVVFTATSSTTVTTATVTLDRALPLVATLGDLNVTALEKDATGTFSTTVTPATGLSDSDYTLSWAATPAGLTVADNGAYTADSRGTYTVTATATSNNPSSYKDASKEYTVTVSAPVEVTASNVEMTYGDAAKAIGATASAGYKGTLSYTSANTAVATVDASGNVTAVAVGTTTITITSAADAENLYLAGDPVVINVTVNAPEGGTTALSGSVSLFHETFGTTASAREWDNSYSVKSGVSSVYSGVSYTVTNANQSKTGNGSTGSGLWQNTKDRDASIIIGPLNVAAYKDMTLTYKWKAGSTKGTYSTTASYATSSTGEYTELTGTGNGATTFVDRTYSLPAAAQVSTLYLKITFNTSNTNAVIDEIDLSSVVSLPEVTLNASGYATYCSEYPLDFTDAETGGYSAWQITNVSSEGVITFAKVTGTVKGGTGLLLKGNTNATVTLTSSNSDKTLDDNMLVGTLAPSYFAAGDIYGLSADTFKKNSAGTMKANKAYLPASEIPSSSIKSFTLVFEDQETGITITETMSADEVREIFDLQGRRLARPIKGINIINGKKVLVK